jgi:hypothetical protein
MTKSVMIRMPRVRLVEQLAEVSRVPNSGSTCV